MVRFVVLVALALVALAPDRAGAQPASGTFRVVDAWIDDGRFFWEETEPFPMQREVVVPMRIDGMTVFKKQVELVYVPTAVKKEAKVKALKASDATGKAIDADTLAELLKEKAPVVLVTGTVPEKHRALFKDKTVFIEFPAPKM
jgi:hypothetical protein